MPRRKVGITQGHGESLYIAVGIDLLSRMVIGWSMKPTLARELALDALLMAVWRRRPKSSVIVHSARIKALSTAAMSGCGFARSMALCHA